MSDKDRMLVISEDIEVILYYLKQSISGDTVKQINSVKSVFVSAGRG